MKVALDSDTIGEIAESGSRLERHSTMKTKTREGALKTENQITEGVIWKQLLLFFFPILFGTLFQQLYNAADAVIVGRFVGKEALSAVGGGTGTVINLLVGFFVGLSSGATVVISQYYGAKKAELVDYAVHTAMAFSIISGLLLMVGGIVTAPAILTAMDTPTDVLDPAILYIRIYYVGTVGNLIYNVGSGILRAVGDSRRPLYFLIASCFTNILLDLLLIVCLDLGVAGAAIATICSQALSAALVILVLVRVKDMHRLDLHRIRTDRKMLHRIIRIGFPAGLQSVMYSLSNIIIQTAINGLGTDTVAAWTVYGKIDALFWMTVSSFGIAITTFAGQNYGAGKGDRVRKGIRSCLLMCFTSTILISVLLRLAGHIIYGLFTSDPEVMRIGMQIVHFLVPTFITYVCVEVISGALRGVGDCWIPTLICLSGICLIRILWIMLAVPLRPDVYTVTFSYPLTWTITSILFILYYCFFSKIRIFRPRPERMSDLA